MGRSERKAAYHLLVGLIGALVMGCLLVVVVLMGPMGAAQADQQRAHANKVEQKNNKTVQVTAAGQNNYRAKGDENPMVYKSVDSRRGFDGGIYSHVLRCPDGYKAIGGGFDLNNSKDRNHWQILASRPDNGGETWVVDALGHTAFLNPLLPTFTAYAACAPRELLPGLRYVPESTTIGKNETKTIWATCGQGERVIGGGFWLERKVLDLVRSERSRDDERSWGSGAKKGSSSGSDSLKSWAVCVSRGALEATRYLEATDRSKERAVANTPSCPQGTYLLSGGAGMPDNADALWSNSSPPQTGAQSWKASAIPTGWSNSVTVHAFALCGRFADGGDAGGG